MTFRRDGSRARVHAAPVAPDGVDLTVVRQSSQGLCPVPRGQNVGRVALVEDGEGRHIGRISQVGIKLCQQATRTHGLVNQSGGRERADITLDPCSFHGTLELLTRQVQAALEIARVAGRHQHLADYRNAGKRDLAQNLLPRGHDSPGEDVQVMSRQRLLKRLLAGAGLAGEKDCANP